MGVVTSFTDNTPSFLNQDLPYYTTPINLRGFYYKKDENSDRKSTLILYSNLRWLYPESYNQN